MTKIKITGNRYTMDWVMDENKEIDLDEVFGFELHWRGDSWHIVVITKTKCSDGYFSYEIGHWVNKNVVKELINNKDCNIIKILNYHNSKNFIEEVRKLTN